MIAAGRVINERTNGSSSDRSGSMDVRERLALSSRQYYREVERGESEDDAGLFERCAVCRSLPLLCSCANNSDTPSEHGSTAKKKGALVEGALAEGGHGPAMRTRRAEEASGHNHIATDSHETSSHLANASDEPGESIRSLHRLPPAQFLVHPD